MSVGGLGLRGSIDEDQIKGSLPVATECVTLESDGLEAEREVAAVQLECMGWMEPPMMLMHSQAGMQTPQIGSSPISDSRTPPGSSGSGCPMRSREASPLDTAAARECRGVEVNEDSSPKSTLVVSPPLQLKSLELEGAKTNLAEVYFIGTPPVSAELVRLEKGVKEVGDSLSNTGSTNTAAPQDWLSSPRDALPPRPTATASAPRQRSGPVPRRHASASGVASSGRRGNATGATGPAPRSAPGPAASPRRRGEEVNGSGAPNIRRTPSAAAMRAGRKLREACSPPRNASTPGGMRQGSAAKGALPKENKRPARPTSKWAWKEQDIRTTPPDRGGSTSSPRSARPEAKVRAALSGTPSARVVAALEGPQGLMSLLGRLAPAREEASVASTPAPATPAFSGAPGEDFHPTDWAAHLRQGQPTSPMARSKSQGALRRAWSPVGPCNSPPKWQPLAGKSMDKAGPSWRGTGKPGNELPQEDA
eukprot:s181_g44.t1